VTKHELGEKCKKVSALALTTHGGLSESSLC